MDRKRGLLFGLILASVSGFVFYFFTSPFLFQQPNQDNPFVGSIQDPNSVSTLEGDIDSCMVTPTPDCDQELLQISKFCQQNKDQTIPACLDSRVQQYIDQRGLDRPAVNIGH